MFVLEQFVTHAQAPSNTARAVSSTLRSDFPLWDFMFGISVELGCVARGAGEVLF
jgi:hypothetical protein